MKLKSALIAVMIVCLSYSAVYAADPNLPKCDLGAEMITFEIVKQIDAKTAQVKITGKVKNLGSLDFKAEKNQVMVQLSESAQTPDNTFKLVVEKEILFLPVGEFFLVEYVRNWETADLEKFGDQPKYRLEIKYSPGIIQDGNTDNDDSVTKNNKRERTSKELRRIWAARSKTVTKME